ncbi:MAG: TAXI family TRAP transporter solute-binding subunit, partial [Rhodopirellula bahusiensis]
MSWTNFLLALFGGVICWVAWIALAGATRTEPVVISTGSEQGIYFQVGKEIGDSYMNRHPEIRCEVIPSEGSRENVTRLQDGTADVAIVQNDAVADERVRSLAILYT